MADECRYCRHTHDRYLDVVPTQGWTPVWRTPLLVLLPLASLLLGVILLLWSVSHTRHVQLLQSLLPAGLRCGGLGDVSGLLKNSNSNCTLKSLSQRKV